GPDSRNRTLLSPFASRTGRNQPKSSELVFGPAKWLRKLVRPEPGMALAYLDYEQQEFGIAAALSRDQRMQAAYNSRDPYLEFAKQAGAVPADGTRQSHPLQRELFKTCCLGVQYGMGIDTLAKRTGLCHAQARELHDLHRATYPDYWRWSQGALDFANMNGELRAAFGWRVRADDHTNPCFLRNFPLQANGAEMLRIACILALEARIKICAPVHDALLIEAGDSAIDEDALRCTVAMQRASQLVLDGFTLRAETKIIRYPDRFPVSESAARMWTEIIDLLEGITADETPTCSAAGQ
ncbi:MAG: polymerase, partial [Chthoniobacter sp.]|nr:polymerase [Chthoniobacter sp.]